MKNKLTTLFIAVLLCCIAKNAIGQNGTTIPCDQLPQKSIPVTAVNDFAKIIDEDAKQALEKEISAYWDTTSIALAVVTVQNMNQNEVSEYALSLFRCWGIGGKASDRGILFLVSMDERKIWITTGYGVEGILPDVTCHRITENDVKPLCKEGKYSDAVVAGVRSIFQTLGTMSWEERMAGITAEKKAAEQKSKEFIENTMNVLMLLGAFGVGIALIGFFFRIAKKKKLQRAIKNRATAMKQEIEIAYEKITATLNSYNEEAFWARGEAEAHAQTARLTLLSSEELIKDAVTSALKDVDEAQNLLEEAEEKIEKSFLNFAKIDKGLKEKITLFSIEAPKRLASAKKQVQDSMTTLALHTAKGYRLPSYVSVQEQLLNVIKTLERHGNDKEFYQKIYMNAPVVMEQSLKSINEVNDLLKKRQTVENDIVTLVKQGVLQYGFGQKFMDMIERYKTFYPKSVWKDHEVQLEQLLKQLAPVRLNRVHTDIVEYNSMVKQDFTIASLRFDELWNQVDQIKQLYVTIEQIESVQEHSSRSYVELLKNAEDKVSKALSKSKDSDVTNATRTEAKSAQQELEKTKVQASQSIVDWVLMVTLLNTVIRNAQSAYQAAVSDISDAEAKRNRIRREKRRQEEDSYAASLASRSYSSSYSSSSSSSSSFGGFGGGSSGGGGGGSSW